MNGKTTTTNTTAPPSAEEKAYLDSQSELTRKQLEILTSQQDFNADYMEKIKPILDQTLALQQQQLAAANDPVQKELTARLAAAQLKDLQANEELAPLQKQVLEKQLNDILRGNAATPEQSAQIDAATGAALDKGRSDINAFAADTQEQLRRNLSPSLGLRPTDTPIVDRGQLVAKEATRQFGNLSSDLAVANAQAKLNYPLAAAGVGQAGADFAGNLKQATQVFQAGLSDAAAINRMRLIGSGNDIVGQGTQTGIGLTTASKGNPLSFQRGSTSTASKSFGISDIVGLAGAAGGFMSGLGAIGVSDERTKEDIQTVGYDKAGHRWTRFKYKGDPNKTEYVGVIAQEAEKISPEAVLTDGTGLKMVAYKRLRRAA